MIFVQLFTKIFTCNVKSFFLSEKNFVFFTAITAFSFEFIILFIPIFIVFFVLKGEVSCSKAI